MSAASPRLFLSTLRELEEHLTVPIPDRVKILSELEYDLVELSSRMVDQGVSVEEARVRAVEALVPDYRTLQELGRLHAPLYKLATERVRDDRLRFLERSALAFVAAAVLLGQTLALLQADLLANPSPFLWPVLGLGALLLSISLAKVFQLWIKGDHRHPDRGVQAILVLSGLIVLVGISGTFLDLFRLTGILEKSPDRVAALLPIWMVRECTLLSVSILLAMAGSFFWFVLTKWLTLVRGAHRNVLGLEGGKDI